MKTLTPFGKSLFSSLAALVLTATVNLVAFSENAHAVRYKSVQTTEDNYSDAFKGKPVPLENDVFVGFGLDYFDSFGFLGRYAHRVVDQLLPNINNSLYVEGGTGLTFYGTKERNDIVGWHFLARARWDFTLDANWIFFGGVGLGYNFVIGTSHRNVDGGGVFPAFGVGAMYNFTDEWAARADIAYEFLGIGIVKRF